MQTPVPIGSKPGSAKFRLVYFDDLTTLPLVHEIDKVVKTANVRRMTLPEVRRVVAADECDIALLPAPEALRLPSVAVIPCSALSLTGPSRLFMIFSKVVPSEIKRVLVDSEDYGTSLLGQMLLAKKMGVRADFVKSEFPLDPQQYDLSGKDNFDAYLLCGKHAMVVRKEVFTFTLDLTAAWYEYAKLPYVLHCWVTRKSSNLLRLDKEIGDVARRNEGSNDIANKSADRAGVSQSGMKTIYERAIHTTFDANIITSLRRYAQELQQARIVQFPPITVYTEPPARRPVGI
ncbi:MAG: MqnA/MqnD/SBP family protein [Candidatus Sumerlaeota bacterium]